MADGKIRIEVVGESGDLQAALRRSRESIRSVGDESDRQTTRAGRHFERLRAKLRRPIQAKVETDTAGLKKLAAELKKIDGTTATAKVRVDGAGRARDELGRFVATGRQAQGALGGLDTSIGQTNQKFTLLRNGMRLLKWPALIAALGTAIQMFSALGAGAVALTSSLAPMSGALIAIPGFLGAMAQGMGVAKFATGGLKEALGGLHEKLDTNSEAFKKLSPAAQDFARYLQQLKPHLRDLQRTAQEGLFPGLREGLHEAMKNFPVVERLVGRTARALGALAASAGKALGSAEWGRDMETIGNANVTILTRLGKAAGNVANAFRHIWVAAAPTLKKLASDVVNLTQKFEESAAAGRKSGGLANFFERARVKLHQFSRIVADVAEGLGNIFKAGGPTGDRLLKSIEKIADRWAKWTGSVRGQNHLRDYFKRAEPNIRQMGGLFADLTKMFLRLGATPGLDRLIAQIRRDLLPAIESIIRTFTTTVGPAFVNLATQLAKLFEALAPHIAGVVKLITGLAAALTAAVRHVPGIGQMTAAFIGLGVAFKALKLTGIITGLKLMLGLLGKFRGAGAAAAGALAGIAGRNAAIAGAGAKAGKGWLSGFKGALKGAAGKASIAAAIALEVPRVLAAGKRVAEAYKRGVKPGFAEVKKFVMSSLKQAPTIGPLIRTAENLGRALGIIGDKGKKAGSDVCSARACGPQRDPHQRRRGAEALRRGARRARKAQPSRRQVPRAREVGAQERRHRQRRDVEALGEGHGGDPEERRAGRGPAAAGVQAHPEGAEVGAQDQRAGGRRDARPPLRQAPQLREDADRGAHPRHVEEP